MICRIWNFVAFIGIVFTSTDYSSLRLVQFFKENDILIGIGSYLRVDLLLIQLFGSVLDRGEHWIRRTNFVLFDTASRLLLCENCLTCTTFEICVERLYYLFAIRENSGFSKVCDNKYLFVFGVYLFRD